MTPLVSEHHNPFRLESLASIADTFRAVVLLSNS